MNTSSPGLLVYCRRGLTANCLGFAATMAAGLASAAMLCLIGAAPARADGGLEWEAGGTFRNAGFAAHRAASLRLDTAGDDGEGSGSARAAQRRARSAARSGDGDDEAPRAGRRRSSGGASASSEDAGQRRARGGRGTRVASLGAAAGDETPKPGRSLSGGGNVSWVASSGCLASNLRAVIGYVAQNYGSVTVSSTCRDPSHNRAVGGAPKSYHLSGEAADFRIHGNYGAAMAYIRSAVGGFKHYGGGLFHIDNGPSRSF